VIILEIGRQDATQVGLRLNDLVLAHATNGAWSLLRAVGGRTAEKMIARVKPRGVYASVVEAPQNAAEYPSVKVVKVFSKFDRKTLEFMAEAVRDGKLVIPIGLKLPLSEAARAHAMAEKGGVGKILLVP
jgi:NADPH:quinone reductase-like Zn-dependent oxidoreductase